MRTARQQMGLHQRGCGDAAQVAQGQEEARQSGAGQPGACLLVSAQATARKSHQGILHGYYNLLYASACQHSFSGRYNSENSYRQPEITLQYFRVTVYLFWKVVAAVFIASFFDYIFLNFTHAVIVDWQTAITFIITDIGFQKIIINNQII